MVCLSITVSSGQEPFITPFEDSDGQETATYFECIDFYESLAKRFNTIRMREIGPTDSGYPLHVVTFTQNHDPGNSGNEAIRILILNAIHPGEPAGVDASMMLMRDLASGKIPGEISKDISLSVIPYYNIGGGLNRSAWSRANQNGPRDYGFRGNAKNLDLNRDFIKMDTRNTRSFIEYFHAFDPELFVDTHTTNGADYSYTMTLVETHPVRLRGYLGEFLKETFTPGLFSTMEMKGHEMVPFVNVYRDTPDKGFPQFIDYPRYSTGYTALYQTIGYMSETHMLKSFRERVTATYAFFITLLENGVLHRDKIKTLREQDRQGLMQEEHYTLTWTTDMIRPDSIFFKGYRANVIQSEITGGERLLYDREQPLALNIPYFNKLEIDKTITIPQAYVIRQAWDKVIARLDINNVAYTRFMKDTVMDVEMYFIEDYQTYQSPYEGHYAHYDTRIRSIPASIRVQKGDYYVPTRQPAIRYLLEALEPEGDDSFFKWNFFDPILQQKEHFSPYLFEETAGKLLQEHPWLKDSLDHKKKMDEAFREDSRAQLEYIYRNSKYFESTYKQYPVYRVIE